MSFFFTPNPFVVYDPLNENRPQLAIDITRRFRIEKVIRNSRLVYYEYDIQDRDRPDIMAEKYYGNSQLDWLFFVTNNIIDPYFQWPLNYKQFEDYIRQKYGSTSVAQGTTHHYEQILQLRTNTTNIDGESIIIPERYLIIDQTTYQTLAPTYRRLVDAYSHEENENNNKRNIKILDKAFVPEILQQFGDIYSS